MKKIITIWLIFLGCISQLPAQVSDGGKGIHALIMASKNYGINYYLMRDAIDLHGWRFTHTGVTPSVTVCPGVSHLNFPPIVVDYLVDQIPAEMKYDCVVIPNGAGSYYPVSNPFSDLINSPEALNLLVQANDDSLALFASCAGVRVFAFADILQNRYVTGSPRFISEYENAGATFLGTTTTNKHPPVVDVNLITSVSGQTNHINNIRLIQRTTELRFGKTGAKESSLLNLSSEKTILSDEPDFAWQLKVSDSLAQGGNSVHLCSDGNYIVIGYTWDQAGGDPDMLVMKISQLGDLLWSGTFGGAGFEYGKGFCETADSYLIIGYSTSFSNGSRDFYLVKLDKTGNMIWQKTYGGEECDEGIAVIADSAGSYYIAGTSDSYGSGWEDALLIKTDTSGAVTWENSYGGDRPDFCNSLLFSHDGMPVIGMTTTSFVDVSANPHLYKIDTSGAIKWSRTMNIAPVSGHGFDWMTQVIAAPDSGFYISGYSDVYSFTSHFLIKTNMSGNQQWYTVVNSSPKYDYGNSLCLTEDGGCLICGTNKEIYYGGKMYDNSIEVTKLDSDGNLEWIKKYETDMDSWGAYITPAGENEYIMTGFSKDDVSCYPDLFILKMGESPSGVEDDLPEINYNHLRQNYPNPFNMSTIIEYEINIPGAVKIDIFSPAGELIKTLVNTFRGSGKYKTSWEGLDNSGSQLSSGIYFCRMYCAGKTEAIKLLLLK